ncbi:MAG: anti-sigma factor [Saprospiraceae bacterium]|nr:anti-sigma factor [Saprospiraceae bacterium]
MRNENHPIDDLFKRGLKNRSVPPPMHVWERIEESRSIRHRGKLFLWRRKAVLLSSAAAVLLLGVWLGWSEPPHLGSFPIAQEGTSALAQVEHAKNTDSTALPATEVVATSEVTATQPPIPKQQASTQPQPAVLLTKKVETATPTALEVIELTEEKIIAKKVAEVPKGAIITYDPLPATDIATVSWPRRKLGFVPKSNPETGCARFSEGKPAVFLSLLAGPSFPSRTFAARDEEYIEYANQRTLTETPQISYGASARLSVVFPWGGAIRSGVGYTQVNEKMVFRNSSVRRTTITDIYGPNGEVIGSDTSYITENTTLKSNNRHRLIDIPFQLGYEARYNKFTLAANAGVNLNIAYSQRGSYIGDQDLLPTRFDSDDPNVTPIYKTKVGLSWEASLGLHYQLSDRIDLMAEPHLRYYPESFTRNEYPLSQKYLVGGLGVGLRVML